MAACSVLRDRRDQSGTVSGLHEADVRVKVCQLLSDWDDGAQKLGMTVLLFHCKQ